MLLKSGKYEEATSCHNRAAEYLLEAMQQTRYAPALESLKLQHTHHLQQTDKLYDRQRRAHMLQIKQNKLQLCSQSAQTLLQGPVVSASSDGSSSSTFHHTATGTSPQGHTEVTTGADNTSPLEEDSVYRTLTENDSLIGFLLRRRQNPDDDKMKSFHSGVPVERVCYQRTKDNFKRCNSEEKEAEDLRLQNEELRKHVKQLLKELEETRKENKQLKERLEGSQTIFSDGDLQSDLLPDLPPLEMPQFDIDFTKESKNNNDDSETDIFGMGSL